MQSSLTRQKLKSMTVRTRIAPSPTGTPHIGTTRTALFNYLFARRNGGKFILRIEDTDRERLVPESLSEILEILKFLKLSWDEGPGVGGPYGPYVQSERLSLYQEYVQKLVDQGKAYYCFCTKTRLAKMRVDLGKKGLPPKYDRMCLSLSKEEVTKKIIAKTPHTMRLKIPDQGETSWEDLIHGKITFKNELLDDQILLKSDGWPTYHLAVVVDDHLMKISHVLRGDEWVSSTPKHLILYKAFGWDPPKFAHLPVVLGSDKQKLSKRHGAKSALEYRNDGYLPEALVNFMALLGWSPPAHRSSSSLRLSESNDLGEGGKKEKEVFSLEELIKTFDLSGVNPTNPIFNQEKLSWFNSQWIRRLPHQELLEKLKLFIPENWDEETIKAVLPLVTERILTLKDFSRWSRFFFEEPEFKADLLKQFGEMGKTRSILKNLLDNYQELSTWASKDLENVARQISQNSGLLTKNSFMILRIVTTGQSVGPPLFESLEILGKEKTTKRIENAVKKL